MKSIWVRGRESILPPDLEAKRFTIMKSNNRRIRRLLLAMFVCAILLVQLLPHIPPDWQRAYVVIFGLCIFILLVGYGLYRIIKHDNEMCRQLGFMCPHCGKPLYEPQGFISQNGRCPKCRRSILPSTQAKSVSQSDEDESKRLNRGVFAIIAAATVLVNVVAFWWFFYFRHATRRQFLVSGLVVFALYLLAFFGLVWISRIKKGGIGNL